MAIDKKTLAMEFGVALVVIILATCFAMADQPSIAGYLIFAGVVLIFLMRIKVVAEIIAVATRKLFRKR